MRKHWKLNTSNPGKFEEFKHLFGKYGCFLEASHFDLQEIDADHTSVVVQKASQLQEIIVDDTALEIEGASVGTNVRWLLDHLSDYVGHKAEWVVLLAYRHENKVDIYKGAVSGTIVPPRGDLGFGFDPVFLPDGAVKTLAESKPDACNARAKAVEALIRGDLWLSRPVIENWKGPWQHP